MARSPEPPSAGWPGDTSTIPNSPGIRRHHACGNKPRLPQRDTAYRPLSWPRPPQHAFMLRQCGSGRQRKSGGRSTRPHLPRSLAPGVHVVEGLLLLECVHTRPEPLVAVGDQLLEANEALEGFLHELFAVLDVIEDLALEGEEAAVDPQF